MTRKHYPLRLAATALALLSQAPTAWAAAPVAHAPALSPSRVESEAGAHARPRSDWQAKATSPGTRGYSAKSHPASTTAPRARDWIRAPAIVDYEAKGDVYAISDLHGRYEEVVQLLRAQGLVTTGPKGLTWSGGKATLVVVGDIINKGPRSIDCVDLLRSLQSDAQWVGGKVIVTMGNHEAEFLDDPFSQRAQRDGSGPDGRFGVSADLRARNVDPADVAAGIDAAGRGAWLRDLPFAAKIGSYFFVHGGDTSGRTSEQMAAHIRAAVDAHGFGHDDLVSVHKGLLGTGNWQRAARTAARNAARLDAEHIVMGHIPHALDAHGEIARSRDGALVKIDTGLGNGNGPARLLHINAQGEARQRDSMGRGLKLRRAFSSSASSSGTSSAP